MNKTGSRADQQDVIEADVVAEVVQQDGREGDLGNLEKLGKEQREKTPEFKSVICRHNQADFDPSRGFNLIHAALSGLALPTGATPASCTWK